MQLAKVTSVSPLEVRLKTAPDGSSTAVDWVDWSVAEVDVEDDVLVATFDRKVALLHRLADDAGMALVAARAKRVTSTVSVPNNTVTAVALNDTVYETSAAMHDPVTNSNRVTVPVDGLYDVQASALWSGNGNDFRWTTIRVNGSNYSQDVRPPPGASTFQQMVSALAVPLNAGDYVDMTVYHQAGSTLTVAADARTFLTVYRKADLP